MKTEDVKKLTDRRFNMPSPGVFGPWVRAQRLAFTPVLTQAQLARMAGTTRRHLQRIELRQTVPSIAVGYRLWRVLSTLRTRGLKLKADFKAISEETRPYVRN